MHIAVCDDNVADRKQTERLLGRESDARIQTSGNLYIDSYGNVDSLMQAPMKYDLFFLDMTESKPDGMETAVMLRKSGVTAPIALCISKIDYRLISPAPENILIWKSPSKKRNYPNFWIAPRLCLKQNHVPWNFAMKNAHTTFFRIRLSMQSPIKTASVSNCPMIRKSKNSARLKIWDKSFPNLIILYSYPVKSFLISII